MRRLLVAILSVILTLILLLSAVIGWLLLTTSGARWLADWALELEPRLALVVEDGAILYGLQISDFGWRDDELRIGASQLLVEWTPTCLLTARVCLDRVAVTGLRVNAQPEEQAEPTAEPMEKLRSPLPIRLRRLQLDDTRLILPGTRIQLRSLRTRASLRASTLRLSRLRAQGLDVDIVQDDAGAAEPTAAAIDASATERSASLPTVELPLDIVARDLRLDSFDLRLGEERLEIHRIELSAALRQSQLALERLQVALQPLNTELALTGNATLADAYPLSLQLQADLSLPDLPERLQLTAAMGGSVEELELTADVSGALALQAEAKLQPLAESLPFDATLRWSQLELPPQGTPVAALHDGELQASGDLTHYRGSLATAVDGEHVPSGDWQLAFEGDLEQLRLDSFIADTLAGRLSGEGLIGWREGIRWQGEITAQDIDPAEHWPDFPGRLSGRLETNGKVDDAGLSLFAATPGITGQLRGYPVAVRGAVQSGDDGWRLEGMRLESGDNRLEVDGRLLDAWDLRGRFQFAQLNALMPELTGNASGRFTVRGAIDEPDLQLKLQGGELSYQEHALTAIDLDVALNRLGLEQSRLRWRADGVRIAGEEFGGSRGQLSGSRAEHLLDVTVSGGDYGGRFKLAGELDDQLDWAGRVLDAVLQAPPRQQWSLAQPVALQWLQSERRLTIAAHCWRQQEGRLCLRETATVGERGSLSLALSDFQLDWLSRLLPQGVRWQAPLDGVADIRWRPQTPLRLHAELRSGDGRIDLDQEDADPLTLDYERIEARLAIAGNQLKASLELTSQSLGEGRVAVRTDMTPGPRALAGQVALDGLEIGLLRAFLPQVQELSGAVSAHGSLQGTLQDPRFIGDIALADGSLSAINMPMNLTDIQLQAAVSGRAAELAGSFSSGDGTADLTGRAAWRGEDWELDMAIDGKRLRFVYEPVARLQVDPELNIHIEPRQIMVSGRVTVPQGKITLRRLPEGAVGVSEDVVVIRHRQREEPAVPAENWAVTVDTELVLGKSVDIQGYGLEGRLAGNLRLRQRPGGVPEAAGELRIVDGRYEAYGQKLEIRQGQLLFSGPVSEPSLNIEAVRQVETVVAGLRVEGDPDAPQVSLFSEPGLPQEEILSYLIRGRPLEGGEDGGEQLLAQAALSLGVFGGKGLAGSLADELGIRDFELGTAGEGEETQVELSGYLTPDLLVRYGIGVFEPINTLTLRYRVSNRFYVEAVNGLESALDFFYEFEF